MSAEELATELHCNKKIAVENKLRYQDFFNEKATLPAILAYYGQAYKCLKAQEYSKDDLRYADSHLWITSFLYGLLRPLDLIHPYRLEGKTKLPSADGANMFAYWKPRLTDMLIDAVRRTTERLFIWLLRMFQHLFDWKRILKEVHVIQPLFMVDQGTRLKAVSVYAKSCRGAMTSFILRNRLSSPADLLGLSTKLYVSTNYGERRTPTFHLKSITDPNRKSQFLNINSHHVNRRISPRNPLNTPQCKEQKGRTTL